MPIANYDFHTHTNASDGALSPIELLSLAKNNGVDILAITDHDTTKGVGQLMAMQNRQEVGSDIQLIAGAEFTCILDRQILHIVGLNLQLDNPDLISHMGDLEKLRALRARKIADKLIKKNLPDLLPLVYEKAAGAQIGRPHFAQVMCDLNIVSSPAAAFKKYLGAGKSANVSVDWPALSSVLNVINQAGGVAVLAHPTKYRLTMSKLRKVISRFSELGGEAIEISYPGITKEQQNILVYEVEKHDLMVSAGSDFHTPANKWITLGHYPSVPDKLKHVLEKICQIT